ncbi:MAG: pentapeptide repeat-containing protein [Opitutales bacterium]
MPEPTKTAEQRAAAWWKDWWAKDYSWEGLARKHPDEYEFSAVDPETSLQCYWLADAASGRERTVADLIASDELIRDSSDPTKAEPEGRLWHIVHAPLKWKDGAPSPKAAPADPIWGRIDACIAARLQAAFRAQNGQKGQAVAPALLHGAVLQDLPKKDDCPDVLYLQAYRSYWQHIDASGRTFGEMARFDGARFGGEAWFEGAQFEREASFNGSVFKERAVFSETQFRNSFSFQSCRLQGDADFSGLRIDSAKEIAWRAAFLGCRFCEQVDFRGSPFHIISAFADARILDRILYPLPDKEKERARRFEQKALRAALRQPVSHRRYADSILLVLWETPPRWWKAFVYRRLQKNPERESALTALKDGARVLRDAMEVRKDNVPEQQFYRFELIARRKLTGTPFWAKVVSCGYGLFGNYGTSIARPILCVLLAFIGFALAYGGLGFAAIEYTGHLGREVWTDAALISGGNTFRPLWIWGTAFAARPPTEGLSEILLAGKDWVKVLTLLLATLQSILSIILFFLFALAVRRRFQIS